MKPYILAILLLASCEANPAGIDIIVNTKTQCTVLPYKEISRIFLLRKKTWENGLKVVVVIFNRRSFEHNYFSRKFLGFGSIGYERRINVLIDSGRADEPIEVDSPKDMLDMVSNTAGAIGYVDGNVYINVDELEISIPEIE